MVKNNKLNKTITEEQFDNGYWYASEIKSYAREIGIPNSSKLRKDELENLIKILLRTGKIKSSGRKNIQKSGIKDLEKGLSNSMQIMNYTSNKQTKDFIISEAKKIIPDIKIKSGVWYRLNRWRDEQVSKNIKITYGDLVRQFITLNQTKGSFEKVPVGRYINFMADYLANEKNATRKHALKEWENLK
ncbi:MAG: SAP domain-containing protein, partial [Calditrichaceae bacterium]